MAKRYTGPHSPQARPDDRRPLPRPRDLRHPLESRTRWITLMGIPFLLSAFWQGPLGLAAHLAAFGGLALGMALTREGLRAEAAYDARPVARRPAWPRKLFGGILTGVALGVGSWVPGAELGAAVIGVAGGVLLSNAIGGMFAGDAAAAEAPAEEPMEDQEGFDDAGYDDGGDFE